MNILKIAALVVLFFTLSSLSSVSFSKNTVTYTEIVSIDTYDVRVNIDGKWYIITYSNDGYIVNIVEDDE